MERVDIAALQDERRQQARVSIDRAQARLANADLGLVDRLNSLSSGALMEHIVALRERREALHRELRVATALLEWRDLTDDLAGPLAESA